MEPIIRIIDDAHWQDIRLSNDPFLLWGRMIPEYRDETWSYHTEEFPAQDRTEMCFPEGNYSRSLLESGTVFVGAYVQEQCVGLAMLEQGMFRYMYVSDLKVNREYRRMGIGKRLIDKCLEIAAQSGKKGIYLIGQDNNLSACLFYIRTGFRIGGLDTEVYRGTKQEGKADILFYLDV